MASKLGKYLNIKTELQRNGVTQKEVASHFDMTPNNLNAKINGHVPFTVPEVVEMRDTFMEGASLDYLLTTS